MQKKNLPSWIRAMIIALFALVLITLGAQATTISKTNFTTGSADGSIINRTVTIDPGDFATGSVVQDVNVSVSFEKIDGSCPTHEGGYAYNGEIYLYLESPGGSRVVLVEDTINSAGSGSGVTYSGIEYGGPVAVSFNDEAALSVKSEMPTSGSFRPEQFLSTFDGEDPVGIWTLTIGDYLRDDPLCFQEFTLTVSAVQTPVMDDQSFNVVEQSPNDTSVGTIAVTDNDPGEKLNFMITSGNDDGIFAIDSLTGEITVVDGSLLDFETPPTSYSLGVQVTDSHGLTDTATITIDVTNKNETPVAVDDTGSTDEDSLLSVIAPGVLGNDSDLDGTMPIVDSADATSAQGATVTVNANGSFSYDPTSATALQAMTDTDSVADTFDYTITDGSLTASATVTVTVSGIDDAPDAVDDTDSTAEETAVTITVLDNDSDVEGDTITVTNVGTPGHGMAVILGSAIKYTPAVDFVGDDTFTYEISANGKTDTATVTVTVTNLNDPPSAVDDNGSTTDEDTPLNVTAPGVLTNDSDPDAGDSPTVSDHDATSAQGAAVTVNADGSFAYNPTGATALQALSDTDSVDDTFDYTISDGSLTASATVTVTVSGIDDAPDAVDDADSTPEETAVTITVLGNDSDPESDAMTVTNVGTPSNGTATIIGSTVVYTPTTNFVGNDSFTYEITANGKTDTATVTVTVTNLNDPPTANDDSGNTTDEDTVLNVPAAGVLGNDTDPDTTDTLSVSGYDAASAQGAAVIVNTDGSFSYNPTGAIVLQAMTDTDSVADTFNYTMTDGSLTASATVTVTVSGIDDAPEAVDDTDSTPEETAGTITVLSNDSDAEGDAMTITNVGTPSNGTAVIVGSTVVYTPTTNFVGNDSFSYEITANGKTDTATVTVTVTNLNDPPTAISLDNLSVNENQPAGTTVGNFSAIDPDTSDSHTYTFATGAGDADNGSFTISGSQLLTASQFDYEIQAAYNVRIQVRDSGGSTFEEQFTISVGDLNDPPVGVDDTETTDEDNILNVAAAGVLGNDEDQDGDTLTVMSADSTSAQGASVNVAADGSFSYDPTAVTALQALNIGENVVDTFHYIVIDDSIVFDTAKVSVTVTGVNDAPVANDDVEETMLETAVIINILDNDTDLDTTDTMSISGFTQGLHGSVTDNGNGTLTYLPETDYIGDDTFTYTIEDAHSASDTAVVTITVKPETYYTFLPIVFNNYSSAPDLVVTSLEASSDNVEVVIANQGSQAIASGFWVDFYVAPNPAPQAANELWQDLSAEGIAWGVTTSLVPGQLLTLTYSTAAGAPNLYYSEVNSNFSGSLLAGTAVYAQVDSAHVGQNDGAILENHEINGSAYNNIRQTLATAGIRSSPSTPVAMPPQSFISLPTRD